MAQTPEGRVKDALRKVLKTLPHSTWHWPATGGYGRSGVHDVVGCIRGRYVSIECKATPKDQLTALQELEVRSVTAAGGLFFRVDCETLPAVVQDLELLAYGPDRV